MSLVLVADDEPAVLEVLSQVIEDLGHDVVRARDGEEALTLARAHRPRLVVTDHMMPRMSGMELCSRLKQEPGLREVPIILLSAVLQQGSPDAAAFLNKPFEITDFEALVHDVLAKAPAAPPEPATPVEALSRWVAQSLQGPLEAAKNELRMLRDLPPPGKGAVEALGAQLQSLERMGRYLQDAARLSAGSVTLRPVEGDLRQPLEASVARCRTTGPGVPVEVTVPPEAVGLRFDPERLEQVFDVLLSNAARQGGVRVELEASAEQVLVRVSDPGPGIPEAELPRLFQPFPEGPARGEALGLYVASELAKLHGGALSAESRPGQGATFSVSLPRVA
ncbi:putative response regulator/sensor histidine kinase [Corallococcus coralloides DSM 2259]|uniref:histidine kinase n=1 Tax=Corallococcus coralloides (strain ATCC 25202 / DSM 2259 / NBRC 100086 / M2) TaxID=1144275 RepID=H8MKK0_CORCM|nr:hybrid sensor histidine kinase/response regulator [Corallococcus coralloides]AFE07991.1 putative response regulator/sensor histidine kinase [Corallococcus coralloides DSM 2259]